MQNDRIYRTRRRGAVGSILIARYASRCEYLAGNAAGQRAGSGQLLLWRAIVEMKRQGCTTFDLGGMDPERTPKGIYDFKAGVNAVPYRLPNEIEGDDRTLMQKMVRLHVTRRAGG